MPARGWRLCAGVGLEELVDEDVFPESDVSDEEDLEDDDLEDEDDEEWCRLPADDDDDEPLRLFALSSAAEIRAARARATATTASRIMSGLPLLHAVVQGMCRVHTGRAVAAML